MTTATISGGVLPQNFSDANGAEQWFNSYYAAGGTYDEFTGSGDVTTTNLLVIGTAGGAVTVSGAPAIDDAAPGGSNSITTTTPSIIFAAPNDTISAANSAATVLGASSGQTTFFLGGSDNSVEGGSGSIVGTVSGNNSTLIGGSGVSLFTITGANNLVVAGPKGITGVDLTKSTGSEMLATNPLGNSGTLVAFLGSGATTVVGGSGASTITGGSGPDAYIFINGHSGGSEVIIGFSAKDNLGFAGYGPNLPAENVGGLGDVMTLSDGTSILFVGVTHKLF